MARSRPSPASSSATLNDDPDNPTAGDPQRMSLFEVHPITKFLVCDRAKTCDPTNEAAWTKIEDIGQP